MDSNKQGTVKVKKVPWILSCRYLLAVMSFLGLACIMNQRINLSVAIVCMVNQTALDVHHTDETAYMNTSYLLTSHLSDVNNTIYHGGNHTDSDRPYTMQGENEDGEFDWSKSTQGIMLGAFFWGYIFTQLPGGWLAMKFGAKKIIGAAMILSSILSLFIPIAARIHPILLICLRILLGLCQGPIVPASIGIWTFWAPQQEKSQLIALTMSGVHVGNIFTLPISALLCEYGFDGGWPTIFYFSGILGLAWVVLWFLLIHDSPRKHRRISLVEKQYIEDNVTVLKKEKISVPWKSVLFSRAYWSILVAHICSSWLVFGILICIPIYMKEVLKFDIKKNGLMSAIPFIGLWIMTVLSGGVADACIRSGIRIQLIRKISISVVGMLVPAGICIALGYLNEEHWILAMVLLTIAVSLLGCLWGCGFAVNCADIAPKYCSLLFGISNSLATLFGFIAPFFIGLLTKNQTQAEWRIVFFIASAVTSFGAIIYLIFGSGEIEDWAKSKSDDVIIKDVTEQLNNENPLEELNNDNDDNEKEYLKSVKERESQPVSDEDIPDLDERL